ncbi:MAG: hypothetical protein WEG40_04045 [Candidatus Rokuibacteriota bacterium]
MVSPTVEMSVAPAPRFRATEAPDLDPFGRSRAAVEVALDLLLAPANPTDVRQLAREIDLSPGAISMARKRLQEVFLLTADNRPLVHELFEALAEAWRPHWLPLSQDSGGGVEDTEGPWVLTGDIAAAVLVLHSPSALQLPATTYVATPRQLHAAVSRFPADDERNAACWMAVAPARLAITRANEVEALAVPWQSGPVAPAVVVGLELSQDPGRGAEILAHWHLSEGSPWRTR